MTLTRARFGCLLLSFGIGLAWGADAYAADPLRCLSPEKRRAAIGANQAIPLARAMHAVRGRFGGEVVRARLCESGPGLVYVLTVLARDGRVTQATVDAANGNLLGRR
jgi:uncharacterized membrane protein YkoI